MRMNFWCSLGKLTFFVGNFIEIQVAKIWDHIEGWFGRMLNAQLSLFTCRNQSQKFRWPLHLGTWMGLNIFFCSKHADFGWWNDWTGINGQNHTKILTWQWISICGASGQWWKITAMHVWQSGTVCQKKQFGRRGATNLDTNQNCTRSKKNNASTVFPI